MSSGTIPEKWLKEPWSETRAGAVVAYALDTKLPKDTEPVHWLATLIQQITNIRHREFFAMRYGLMDEQFHSYTQIGKHFGVSKARACQIDHEILDRLAKKFVIVEV